MTPVLEVANRLTPEQTSDVLALLTTITDHDGLSPISEHVWLHVRDGGDAADQHLLALDAGKLIGYAHLDMTDPVEGPSAELAVHPNHRRHGVGRHLLQALLDQCDGELRLWAHGQHGGAAELAQSMGFAQSRVLWQMRRSLLAPLERAPLPGDVVLRPFEPDRDVAAWLALNERAFQHLPDQATWTQTDLERRMLEPWFDPNGFIVADRPDGMCGFNWTKIHGNHHHGHDAIGEIYVIAVDPAQQGRGLGRVLTIAGLQHLRGHGLSQAMLYVDSANTSAIRMYEGLGFARWDTDVLFRHRPSRSPRYATMEA